MFPLKSAIRVENRNVWGFEEGWQGQKLRGQYMAHFQGPFSFPQFSWRKVGNQVIRKEVHEEKLRGAHTAKPWHRGKGYTESIHQTAHIQEDHKS